MHQFASASARERERCSRAVIVGREVRAAILSWVQCVTVQPQRGSERSERVKAQLCGSNASHRAHFRAQQWMTLYPTQTAINYIRGKKHIMCYYQGYTDSESDFNYEHRACYMRLWNSPGGWQRAGRSVCFALLLDFSATLYAEHWILNANWLCRRAMYWTVLG